MNHISIEKQLKYARELYRCAKYQEATSVLESIYIIAEESGDRHNLVDIMSEMTKNHWKLGNVDQTEVLTTSALGIANEIGYKLKQAYFLNVLGLVTKHKNKVENAKQKAIEYYRESLKIREEEGDLGGTAVCFNNIAICYTEEGDFYSALEYYGRSLEVKKQLGSQQGIATTLNNIAELHSMRSEFHLSLNTYKQAQDLFILLKDDYGLALTSLNIGLLHWSCGNINEAKDHLIKSQDMWERLGIKSKPFIDNLAALACVYAEFEDFEKADSFLKKAEKFVTKTQILQSKMRLLYSAGFVSQTKGNIEDAFIHYTQCLKESKMNDFLNYSILSLGKLAEIYLIRFKLTMEEKYVENARKTLIDAESIAANNIMPVVLIELIIIRAMLEIAIMNYQEGAQLLLNARTKAEKSGNPRLLEKLDKEQQILDRLKQKVIISQKTSALDNKIQEIQQYIRQFDHLIKSHDK